MERVPPTIDMRPDGTFQQPRPVSAVPISAKLMLGAIAVAVIGISVLIAVVAIWVVSMILPVIVVAAAFAYGLYRYRRWQLFRGHAGPLSPYQPRRFGE